MATARALDPEVAKIAAQAKRRRRLILAIFAGNALVFALLVGGPYFRGRHRAMAGREAFGELTACLWGGRLADDPGLALPPGEEQAYIDAFRAAPENWPMHCADELGEVAPEEIFWLFPDTRHAEGEVRRAAAMVRDELAAAEGADRGGTVPSRPRLAVQRLQAALTIWSEEADVYIGLEDPLIELPEATATLRPERVPLRAAEDADVWMEPRGDGLEIRAMDERGISWVRVGGGRVDMRRLRKPALVDAFGASERWPLLVWRTPDARCAPDCARQASGVAFLTDDTDVTPDPIWMGAHPAGPTATHVRADGEGNVWIVAATTGDDESPGRALRSFPGALAPAEEETERDESEEEGPRPIVASESTELGDGPAVILPSGVAHLAAGEPILRGTWLAERVGGTIRIHRVTDEGLQAVGTVAAGEGVELSGDETSAAVLVRRANATGVFRCAAGCAELGVIADAEHARAAALGDALVVAYDRGEGTQIRIARWVGGDATDEPAPAACTSDEGGFCGPPVMGARGGRLALGARDGTDLWVIETRDGASWRPLSGLR
ncbi:MAG: hypothetical protein JJ863_19465 [Deltaproteobacteria bacterium]|nr:hypothetical protein [Deltaproteobacteria bacterium]